MKKLEQFKVSEYPLYESSIGCFVFIQFDTLDENQNDLNFATNIQCYHGTKNHLFCAKRNSKFGKRLTLFLLSMLPFAEAVVCRCSAKQTFLKLFQNSQKNTSAGVSVVINVQAASLNFSKEETLAQVFSCKICQIFKNTYFIGHLGATTSVF